MSLFRADPDDHRPLRVALWLAWLLVAGWLALHHVFWRDEVRAFTLALSGDDTVAMLRGIQGEGHPALWYLLLRGVHAVTGTREALPIAAFGVGAAATALFAWRAPFRPVVIALTLFGAFALHEYVVIARNYGIAMLLMFAFAAAYPRGKRGGVGLGLILALLCNTNAPAVLLAGGLAVFWGVELLARERPGWTRAWRHYLLNIGVLSVGVGLFVATVYPPYNDAAISPLVGQGAAAWALALFDIARPMSHLLPSPWWGLPGAALLLIALVIGGPIGLVRSPGGLAAGLAIVVALPFFFHLVYGGSYRHEALFVVYVLTLHWLVADGGGGAWRVPPVRAAAERALALFGQGALLVLLFAQVMLAVPVVAGTAAGGVWSRSRDLAMLLRRPPLDRAVVIAFPDVLLEPLAWYAPNPVWLVRERRWGRVPAFTKAAERDVSLGELLGTARCLRAATGRPVAIVLKPRLAPDTPAQAWREDYLGALTATPGEVRAFLAGTRRIARFGPAATDESYDVYLLR